MSFTAKHAAAFGDLAQALSLLDGIVATIEAAVGNKAALTTTDKGSLVAAINELDALIEAASGGTVINDTATLVDATWSSQRIINEINARFTAILNGAAGDSDTMKELADRITALAQADAGLVSTAQAQAFNAVQQAQACANIGIGDPEHDYVAEINAALPVRLR